MARVAGVQIPDDKRVEIALTYIFGIGRTSAQEILETAKVNMNTRVKDLAANDLKKISDVVEEKYKVEGDLRREISGNIKHLRDVSAYRGLRHMKGLPVRGQRTRTNSRTRRGNVRRTMGSGKRSVEKK